MLSDDTPIDELQLSIRTANILKNSGFSTVGDVRKASDIQLISLPNCGRKSLEEIRGVIAGNDIKTLTAELDRKTIDRLSAENARLRAVLWSLGVNSLSPEWRHVKVLSWLIDGFSQKEIAERLGVSPSRAHQIVAKIRRRVNDAERALGRAEPKSESGGVNDGSANR